jgi:hypothetical protein
VPEVKIYQVEDLDMLPPNVKGLVLLDNATAHPSESVLYTQDGNFRCMCLPKTTKHIIQALDQGIILATERLHRKRFLGEVMIVLEDKTEES